MYNINISIPQIPISDFESRLSLLIWKNQIFGIFKVFIMGIQDKNMFGI